MGLFPSFVVSEEQFAVSRDLLDSAKQIPEVGHMTKYINTNENKPAMSAYFGRFQVSVWEWRKVVSAPESERDFKPEREYVCRRACIRHSRWDKMVGVWDRQLIWCNEHELESLKKALDIFFSERPPE